MSIKSLFKREPVKTNVATIAPLPKCTREEYAAIQEQVESEPVHMEYMSADMIRELIRRQIRDGSIGGTNGWWNGSSGETYLLYPHQTIAYDRDPWVFARKMRAYEVVKGKIQRAWEQGVILALSDKVRAELEQEMGLTK